MFYIFQNIKHTISCFELIKYNSNLYSTKVINDFEIFIAENLNRKHHNNYLYRTASATFFKL